MKRTIIIIAFLILLISIPMLAESNDSTQVNFENIVLQNQEVRIPWYKNMNYTLGYNTDRSSLTSDGPNKDTLKAKNISFLRRLSYSIGYSGGLCYTGRDLMKYSSGWDVMPWMTPSNYLYWLNSVEISAIYPLGNKKGIEVGVGYGWARLEGYGGVSTDIYNFSNDTNIHLRWGVRKTEKIYLYMANLPNDYGFSVGGELIYSKGHGIERYYENWDLKDSLCVIRNGIGGGIFIRWFTKIEISENLNVGPFILVRAAYSYEFQNNSPRKGMWKDKLELNFSGIYVGVKLNFGGAR